MAAIGTGAITLTEVKTHLELNGEVNINSLQDAVDVFVEARANNTYFTSPADRLGDFRGYDHAVADITPPSAPTGLVSSNKGVQQFTLSWTASTDNIAVTGYKIYNDGVFEIDTLSTSTLKVIAGLARNDSSQWTVTAYDAQGNESAASSNLLVTLLRETVLLRSSQNTSALACSTSSSSTTYYHDGLGLFPTTGDKVFTTNFGIGVFNGADDFWRDDNQSNSYEIDKNGTILDDIVC